MDFFDYDTHCGNANVVKEAVLEELLVNKDIDEKQFEEYSNKWGIVIIRRKWYKKIFKTDPDNFQYKFIKII